MLFPDAEEEGEASGERVTDENSNVAGSKDIESEMEEESNMPSMSNGYDCDVGRRYHLALINGFLRVIFN